MSLSECAMDNDVLTGGTVTSLSTSDGCCLTACSDSIKKVRPSRSRPGVL